MLHRSTTSSQALLCLLLALVAFACRIPPEDTAGVPKPSWHEIYPDLPYVGGYVVYCDFLPPIPSSPLKATPASLSGPYYTIKGSNSFEITNTSDKPVEITEVRLSQCMFAENFLSKVWTALASGMPGPSPKPGQLVWLSSQGCVGVLAPGQSCQIETFGGWGIFRAKIELFDSKGLLLEIPYITYP